MIRIPKSLTVNTGKQEQVYPQIDEFFASVKQEIEVRQGVFRGPSRFERRILGLCRPSPGQVIPLDDMLHLLLYQEKVVAVVTETRTESNYVHYDFFSNLENLLED